ncbi:hypothetical protein NM688_g7532 [Phlebia brevispora]|uniref:Uncharacterized protein n=1 Tax=Phlebia brevispora TaxID=194682 RepID=A0ACC1S461_9APHY|nr:hypothetical protein NM688_g7532 [Phlebia brevispora]
MFSVLSAIVASLALETRAQSNLESPSTSGALSALKYTNVGGSGSYNQVTNMIAGQWPSCTANPSCIQSSVSVSGPLAPFDEDMTFIFRGPMTLYSIAIYQPSSADASTWELVSIWSQNGQPNNMVFMNNLGGGASGIWTICGRNSQSYASGNWSSIVSSPNAELYPGNLLPGQEINAVVATVMAFTAERRIWIGQARR